MYNTQGANHRKKRHKKQVTPEGRWNVRVAEVNGSHPPEFPSPLPGIRFVVWPVPVARALGLIHKIAWRDVRHLPRRHGVAGEISRGCSEARTEPPDCGRHEDSAPEVREKRWRAARAGMFNGWREDFPRTSGAHESFQMLVRGFRSCLTAPPANLFRHSVAEDRVGQGN